MGLTTGTQCDIYFPAEETPITELEETGEVPESPEIPEIPDVPETSSENSNNNSTTTSEGTENAGNNSTTTTEEQDPGTNSTISTPSEGTNSNSTSSDPTTSSEGTDSTVSSSDTNSTSSDGTNTGDLNPSKTNTTNSTDSKISETLNEKENSSNDLVSNNKKPNLAIIAVVAGIIGALLVLAGIVFLWKYSKKIRRSQQTQPQRSKTWIRKPPKLTIPIKIIDDASNTSSAQHSPELSRTHSLRSAQDSPIMYRGGSPSKARIVGHSRFRNYSPEVRDRRVVDDEQHQGFGLAIKPLGYNGTHGDEIDSPGIPVPRSREEGKGFGLTLKPIEIENEGNDVENPMNEAEVIHPETISIKSVPIIPQEVKVEENHNEKE